MSLSLSLSLARSLALSVCCAVLKIGFSFRLSAPLLCPLCRLPSTRRHATASAPAVFLKTQVFVERESERAARRRRRRRRQSSFGEKPLIEEGKKEGRKEKEGRKDGRKRRTAHFSDGSISLYCRTRKQKILCWCGWRVAGWVGMPGEDDVATAGLVTWSARTRYVYRVSQLHLLIDRESGHRSRTRVPASEIPHPQKHTAQSQTLLMER